MQNAVDSDQAGADVVVIDEDEDGHIDEDHLRRELRAQGLTQAGPDQILGFDLMAYDTQASGTSSNSR